MHYYWAVFCSGSSTVHQVLTAVYQCQQVYGPWTVSLCRMVALYMLHLILYFAIELVVKKMNARKALGDADSPPEADVEAEADNDTLIQNIKSLPDFTNISICFTNRNPSRKIMDVRWVNFDGVEQSYNEVGAGQNYVQASYLNHHWRVYDKDANKCVRTFVATELTNGEPFEVTWD